MENEQLEKAMSLMGKEVTFEKETYYGEAKIGKVVGVYLDGRLKVETARTPYKKCAFHYIRLCHIVKPKKKVTLYNYTYENNHKIYETGFSSLDFNMFPLTRGKLLKTETKEIEINEDAL